MAENGQTTAQLHQFARVGATIEYAETLRRQAALKRLFAGVDKAARRQVINARMEKARAARGNGNRKVAAAR